MIEDIEIEGEMKPQILFSHYTKPMANKYVIHRDSAISTKSKTNILIADLVRVMKNVSIKCTNEERRKKIQEYMNRMQYSGYSKKERANVYRKAKRKYEQMLHQNEEGLQPLYRDKWWNKKERSKNKQLKRSSWYCNDGSEAVFFVDATPNEELAHACRKEFKNAGLKVKVIERTGVSITKTLVKSDPFKENGCHQMSCKVCSLGSGINCKTREVVYKIGCEGINKNNTRCIDIIKYEGETSRSMEERYGEHDYLYNHQNNELRKKSVFYDHVMEEHNGINPPLKLEILARCPGDAALRQAIESIRIREEKPVLNGKEECVNNPRKRKDVK